MEGDGPTKSKSGGDGATKSKSGGDGPTNSKSGEGHRPLIGFDMGGTSTDVSRYAGKYEHTYETVTAGVAIQAPQQQRLI